MRKVFSFEKRKRKLIEERDEWGQCQEKQRKGTGLSDPVHPDRLCI